MTATTASETKKAPLFYWNGIRDEKGGKLQHVTYTVLIPDREVMITPQRGEHFSALVRTYFTVGEYGRVFVDADHPFYPQAKAAATIAEARANARVAARALRSEAIRKAKQVLKSAAKRSRVTA
ncbi:hypothetical protein LOD75_10990 [Xylella fastidiosa subsp. multiplex]|uniref:hypothetical protein n=1 Tax=Xylella fastidiosa TaxID=2371 RepID=UPI00235FB90F|nr:hypothetical protein [Xylella fastidiosa]MDD0910434.1 hypothetical protein [Xylella fastidiosa subsp. multiplex]